MFKKQGEIKKSDHYKKFSIKMPVVLEEGDKRVKNLHIPEEELIVQTIVEPLEKKVSISLRNYFAVDNFPFSEEEKKYIWNQTKFLIPTEMRDYNRVYR